MPQVSLLIRDEGWTEAGEPNRPYAFKDMQWVGYDNEASIAEKARYALDKGLGGVMIWDMSKDDHRVSHFGIYQHCITPSYFCNFKKNKIQ